MLSFVVVVGVVIDRAASVVHNDRAVTHDIDYDDDYDNDPCAVADVDNPFWSD